MRRWSWLAVVALVMVPAIVFAVNEVQFGSTVAYRYPGGTISIPVLVTNDVPITALGVAFRVSSGQLVIDSVTGGRRVASPDQAVFVAVVNEHCTNSPAGTLVDSGYLIYALKPQYSVAAGSGEICSIWLHGYSVGAQLSFELPSALQPAAPGGCVDGQVTTFISPGIEDIFPVARSSNLMVVDAPLVVDAPAAVTGYTLKELRIPVAIASYFGQSAVTVLGFVGPNGPTDFPSVTGTGPWEISFTPGLHGNGAYLLTILASNDHGQSVELSIAISIVPSNLSGDIDCNGYVDLSDLSRMINWLLNHTLPPVCP